MKLSSVLRLSPIFIVLTLLLINMDGVNFDTTHTLLNSYTHPLPHSYIPKLPHSYTPTLIHPSTPSTHETHYTQQLGRTNGNQRADTFRQYNWGGVGDQENEMFGWNMTIIDDFNGDTYTDLVISTPWHDSSADSDVGMVCIFFGSPSNSFNDINYSKADIVIEGDGQDNRFGWDVADAGDMNGDDINDLIVGAPGVQNNRGRAYIFYGGSQRSESRSASNIASRILDGPKTNSYYGTAVAGIGDIDNDGFGDVIVGAPGSDEAVITYGYYKNIMIYPNIWDDDPTTPGVIRFNKGVNNTENDTNTWGRLNGDDGWDWIDGITDTADRVYGHHVTTPTHGTTIDLADCYGPWEPDGPDGDNITRGNRSALQVIAGRTRETSNPYGPSGSGDPMTSAAWGVEFNITPEMMDYLSNNCTIKVAFDYESWDNEKVFNSGTTAGTEELCTVRSRLWNSSGKYYLGDVIKNNKRYIFYHYQEYGTPEWNTVSGTFEYDIREFIDGAGTYYWDFGCSFGYSDINQNNNDPDEGILTYFDDVSMVITNEREVRIQGARNSGFGTAVKGIGDLNSNGYPEILIGAPLLDAGYAVLFEGQHGLKSKVSMNLAKTILTGKTDGDKFGYSLAVAGDVDNDGLKDIIIGAPGGNYANLYYGSTLNAPLLIPDLSENEEERSTPQLEFNSGLNSTGDTPGPAGADDGWDTWDGVYGCTGSPGSSVMYNNANILNPTNVANDDKLLIGIGAHYGNSAKPDSGAYGVEFEFTQEMVTAIEAGGEVVLSYDWYFENLELEADETVWVKTFIRDPNNDFDLGWDLDKGASGGSKDQAKEVYWSRTPEDTSDVLIKKCTECFSQQGSYYLDVGGKVRAWTSSGTNIEDGIFHFDNIYLRINPPPDTQFFGVAESGFGTSVGVSDRLNIDDYADILIGAPYYDSVNGMNSGALFGFISDPDKKKAYDAEDAEFVMFGKSRGDYFGRIFSGSLNLDSDGFPELITSSVNYDYLSINNIGRVYLLSIIKAPRVRLLYPLGGEVLTGEVMVNATVVDPDDNVDIAHGVQFYYSDDLDDWIQFGVDTDPSLITNIFQHSWNTTMLPDGYNYYIKAWVRDLDLKNGEDISLPIVVDNPHPPEIKIIAPARGEAISGKLEIKVSAKDSAMDIVGGGINTDLGVKFYFSKDPANWELLGTVIKGKDDIYSLIFDAIKYPDGEYWIKVNATDWDGFEVEEILNFTIDNPARAPELILLSPSTTTEVTGNINLEAAAFDFDGDINSSGVTFYLSSWDLFISENVELWEELGNSPEFIMSPAGLHVYIYEFNTTFFKDGIYRLKALVNDSSGLTNQTEPIYIIIHNNENNAPFIKLTSPSGGKVLDITQFIKVLVWDLEDNIDYTKGVVIYYSSDKEHWRYLTDMLTPEERIDMNQYYQYLWSTDTVPDGEYWLNVSVKDTEGLTSWDVLDEPVIIHNRNTNPPIARFITPTAKQYINGTFEIQIYARDLEDKVDKLSVSIYITSNFKMEDWVSLATAKLLNAKEMLFGYSWDTTKFDDGKYWLKLVVLDTNDLEGSAISDYFYIHNKLDNPPIIQFLGPHAGEVKGITKLNASVFDLENNLDDNGVYFEFSTSQDRPATKQWTLIGNDPTPKVEGLDNIYEFFWDTTTVPDNIYWLRARAADKTGLEGIGNSESFVIVHNNKNNPPILKLLEPVKDVDLKFRQTIKVEILDFEDDVETVTFYYSKDNESWKSIESNINENKEGHYYYYTTIWDTSTLKGEIYLNIRATDELGNSNQIIEGPFKTGRSDTGEADEKKTSQNYMLWIVIIVIIIIMILVIILLLRRSKHREEELIEEVATEIKRARTAKREIIETPYLMEPSKPDTKAGSTGVTGISGGLQTYIPPPGLAPEPTAKAPQLPATAHEREPEPQPDVDVDTIESYRSQLITWNEEGYNVSRLEQLSMTDEQMFAKAFPITSSNITRLKDILEKLNTLDTLGFEAEVDSINSKLYEPDLALEVEREFKELEQNITSTVPAMGFPPEEPEGFDDTESPPDIDLPSDLDLPPEPEQDQKGEGKSKSDK